MNAYRVALILCRAVAIALWWSTGLRFVSAAIIAMIARFGLFGSWPGVPVTLLYFQSLSGIVPLAIAAIFLQVFAVSLATSMTGSSAFEGDAIALRRSLDGLERALASAGAGLFLLFFGAANAIYPILASAYTILVGGFSSRGGMGASFAIYSSMSSLAPAILQCLVGFVLAFRLGLRRLIKSAE